MRLNRKIKTNSRGQAIVEYIIIIVIVAVAALTVMGIFSQTIREKISGVVAIFGGSRADEAQTEAEKDSVEFLQELDATGGDIAGGGGGG